MTHSRFTPLARALAITSLTGAALLAGSLAPAMAQTATTPSANTPPAAAAAVSTKPETVDQRITTLKAALKITPDQEAKWTAVSTAMRDSAGQMEKLVATKRAIPPEKTSAVDDLMTYQEFTQVRLDGLKNLNSAFKSLYDSMPAEQKKNADVVFEKYGPSAPTQG
ncbi:MAG: Spy/CpxP family protein refolding chaperone [Reyranella sp.]|uniref:Spy/CpxP family protein refolding chaperone n=1 Tax=Reyranella sp. TaxID=1929291 RepID=UPI002730F43B|nr:Spy/CpxP family protein refolding chaperone [Reyranella sp.]MDP1966703.1 Spy/CpxP family protein refolding chaperone [Reyranella sp.]MDP2372246.1 Spy/CpxP family protein refolding chaperone [Reyranella sp.]